ncbi:hypothetical protein BH23PAT1_BH23PAT1_2180 [soil metagenome]
MSSIGPNTPVLAEGLPVTFRDQTVWRDPTEFEESYLIEVDFDETCFTTFISQGDGIEVHEAYESAVEMVLGPTARQDFSNYGGLSNRAPLDVIISLLSNEQRLIHEALDHARTHFSSPEDVTDIGLGLIARFVDRGQVHYDELTVRAVTEMLVIRKKEKLIPQITREWPLPVKGYDEFWTDLHERKASDERWRTVHTAIVSSGHTDFIQKTMETAGLPHPDVYMTDDEMRRQVTPRTKPDPYALELVRNAWLNAYLIPRATREQEEFIADTKSRQIYVGDDAAKDGEMAANDGVQFAYIENAPDAWRKIGEKIFAVVESGGKFSA